MFLSEYIQKLTGRGRLLLPKKMRQELKGDRVVLSKGFERCLFGYEEATWEKVSERQLEEPVAQIAARDLRRYIFSGAVVVDLDSQGRFVIPSKLLEYASISEEAIIIGAGDHFEIWDPAIWSGKLEEIEAKGRFE